jgi:uncharacterized protein
MDFGLLAAAAGLVFAGIVKGSVGFGLPMIAAPVLAGYVGPRLAVIIMSIVNLITAVVVAARVRGVPLRACLGTLAPMIGLVVIGTTAGAQLLKVLDQRILSILVGVTAMLFALLSASRIELKLPPRHVSLFGALVGLGAGLLGGTTSFSGPPIVMYFHALGLDKQSFMLLLNITLSTISIVQVANYVQLGLFTTESLELSALTMVCVGLGVGVGFLIQDRVNQRLFNRGVIMVIFLVGLNLVWRAVSS